MFSDRSTGRRWPLWLLGLWLCLLIPEFARPELAADEAYYALLGRQLLVTGGDWLSPRLPGDREAVLPALPWLTALLSTWPGTGDWLLRLAGLLPLAGLAALAAWCAGRQSVAAGAFAAAVVVASPAGWCFGRAVRPDMLTALLLNGAWLCWYVVGREKRRWLPAWSAAYGLVGLAVLASGARALVIFYLPLILLRRPISLRRRWLLVEHLIPLALFAAVGGAWLVMSPNALVRPALSGEEAGLNYLVRLLTWPWVSMALLGPWLLLVWPGFCIAFRPLETRGVFCGFLRTICVSLFLTAWLVPAGGAELLLPLLGPVAILGGQHYDVLVRRHGARLRALPRVASVLALCLSGLSGLVLLLVAASPDGWGIAGTARDVSAWCAGAGAVLGVGCLLGRRRVPLWAGVGVATIATCLGVHGLAALPDHGRHPENVDAAYVLARNLPARSVVYVFDDAGQAAPGLWYYLRRGVHRIDTIDDLPEGHREVYLLTWDQRPISKGREWVAAGDAVSIPLGRVRIWMGVKR